MLLRSLWLASRGGENYRVYNYLNPHQLKAFVSAGQHNKTSIFQTKAKSSIQKTPLPLRKKNKNREEKKGIVQLVQRALCLCSVMTNKGKKRNPRPLQKLNLALSLTPSVCNTPSTPRPPRQQLPLRWATRSRPSPTTHCLQRQRPSISARRPYNRQSQKKQTKKKTRAKKKNSPVFRAVPAHLPPDIGTTAVG